MPTPANPLDVVFDGRNPLVSDVNAHLDPDERYFVEVKEMVFRANRRIQKRNGKTLIGTSAGARITALHAMTYYDPAGVPSWVKYRTYGTKIAATIGTAWTEMTLPYTPSSNAQWVFANFAGKVFAVNGNQAMLVSAGLPTDVWREVGQTAPLVAPNLSVLAADPPVTNSTTGTTVSATNGSALVNNTGTPFVTGAPSPWIGKTITINGRNYEIADVGASNQLTLTEEFKEDTASGLPWTVYPGIGAWEEGPQYAYAFYNPTTGHVSNISPIAQIVEKRQVGRTITVVIAGGADINAAYNAGYTQIQLFRTPLNGAQLVALNEKLASNNAGSNITYVETVTKFADTYLTKLPAEQVIRRKPQLDVVATTISGATNASPIVITTLTAHGFTTGQTVLVSGVNGNTAANGRWVVVVLTSTTLQLFGSVGNGGYTTGGSISLDPAIKFLAVAAYKGRLWAITRNRIYWCASFDEVPLWGVGEECWPAQFSREIPEAFGLVVIGEAGSNDRLVIQTAEGDYTVEGYDNRDIEVFPLRRRPSGCFLGGAAVVDGRLVELYRDRRLLDTSVGDLAAPIQNRFNDIPVALTTYCRMHWFALNQRDYLLVSIPGVNNSSDVDRVMVFDYSLQKWSEFTLSPGITAFATVKDSNGSLELWVGDTGGSVWRISDSDVWTDAGSNYTGSLKTCVLRFGRRVRLVSVQAFVNDGALTPWALKIWLDEQTSEGSPAAAEKSYKATTLNVARHQSQSAQGRELEFVPIQTDRVVAEAFQFGIVTPTTNGDIYLDRVRFLFTEVEPGGQE